MEFGARIRAIRQDRGLTQEELAHRAGMSLKSVYFIETGRSQDPHYSTLTSIASALGVDLVELLDSPKAEAPTSSTSPEDEERRVAELERWIEYLDHRARVWQRQATTEENHHFVHWQSALQWESDVSEEALDLYEAAERVVQRLAPGGTATGSAALELQRLEESYRRLWESRRVVGANVVRVLDAFAEQIKDTASIYKARARRERMEVEREAKIRELRSNSAS